DRTSGVGIDESSKGLEQEDRRAAGAKTPPARAGRRGVSSPMFGVVWLLSSKLEVAPEGDFSQATQPARRASVLGGDSGRDRRRADQMIADGEERELETVRHAELAEDLRQVVLDGLLAQREALRDFLVRQAAADRADDLQLARRQAE